jgi:hypothetical protein
MSYHESLTELQNSLCCPSEGITCISAYYHFEADICRGLYAKGEMICQDFEIEFKVEGMSIILDAHKALRQGGRETFDTHVRINNGSSSYATLLDTDWYNASSEELQGIVLWKIQQKDRRYTSVLYRCISLLHQHKAFMIYKEW